MRIVSNVAFALLFMVATVAPTLAQTGEEPAVTVNGEVMTKAELDKQVEQRLSQMSRMAAKQGKEDVVTDEMKKRIRQQVIDQSVQKLVLESKAHEADVEVTEADVDEVVKQQEERAGSKKRMEKLLEKQDMTRDDFRDKIRKRLRLQKFLESKTGDISVSEEEARSFYEQSKERLNADSFEKAKGQIMTMLERRKKKKEQQRVVQELRAESDVTIHVDQG